MICTSAIPSPTPSTPKIDKCTQHSNKTSKKEMGQRIRVIVTKRGRTGSSLVREMDINQTSSSQNCIFNMSQL
eukprot:c13248_g1_i1 orf=194-412(+)